MRPSLLIAALLVLALGGCGEQPPPPPPAPPAKAPEAAAPTQPPPQQPQPASPQAQKVAPSPPPAAPPAAKVLPQAGRDYRLIPIPQPTVSGNKVEVLEFFWYACPHCYHLQPSLQAWLKRKPVDVEFRRQPAAFQENWLQLARTYYALEAMGLPEKLHHDVFAAIHDQRSLNPQALARDPKPVFDWMASKGVDRQKFVDIYNSFAVNARTQRTIEVTGNYDVNSTPTVVVDGKYLTQPSMVLKADKTVDYDRYFQVLDAVIAMARKQRTGKK
jgi:thiol:disulfide interchange protein DsbA